MNKKLLTQEQIIKLNFNFYSYLFAYLINIIPVILEMNTGDQAAEISEIDPFTPSELKVKLNI